MRKAWFYRDPESGLQRDEFGGTFVYEDTGRTLAQDNEEYYFQGPLWCAWMLDAVDWLRGWIAWIAVRFAAPVSSVATKGSK